MSDFINHISIRNFKSIKNCEVNGCKRINLFIGRPNVGKSNIIEALSIFSISYLQESILKNLTDLIRFEHESELFYNGRNEQPATIYTDTNKCSIRFNPKEALVINLTNGSNSLNASIDEKLMATFIKPDNSFDTGIKKYQFKHTTKYKYGHSKYLIPPYGYNLPSIIENYSELKEEVANFFKEFNLEIAFDRASQTIKVIKQSINSVILIPYNSIADTLQRLIFYKAAIASNDNSILLFEEPEAHAFPPYMTQLTQDMIYKKDNQYFLATHSPVILNDLLENAPDELAVFVVYWENGSTQVRALSQAEMHEAYQSGVDFFTNSESFIG